MAPRFIWSSRDPAIGCGAPVPLSDIVPEFWFPRPRVWRPRTRSHAGGALEPGYCLVPHTRHGGWEPAGYLVGGGGCGGGLFQGPARATRLENWRVYSCVTEPHESNSMTYSISSPSSSSSAPRAGSST